MIRIELSAEGCGSVICAGRTMAQAIRIGAGMLDLGAGRYRETQAASHDGWISTGSWAGVLLRVRMVPDGRRARLPVTLTLSAEGRAGIEAEARRRGVTMSAVVDGWGRGSKGTQ